MLTQEIDILGIYCFEEVFLSAWYKYSKYENRFHKCRKKHFSDRNLS